MEGARELIETMPPEILADVMRHGVYLVGGGALIKKLPEDPVSAQSYYYRTLDSNQKFQLFTKLENSQDKDLITTSYNNCGGTCNFAVISSNTTPDEQ